ncbi:MAG: ATP synthase F1 subunit epsilon [bacterium]
MAETLTIEVVTPERAVISGEAEEVILPGSEGQMGILPGHLPLLSGLGIGQMVVRGFVSKGGTTERERKFFVDGGFVEVLPNKITVMTEACDGYDEIDAAEARQAIELAEKELLQFEERSKTETVEEDVMIRHQEALKRARTRLAMSQGEE